MDEVRLRRARLDDAAAVAEVYLASFHATYDFPLAHTDQQVRDWIGAVLIPTEEVWIAVGGDGSVVGIVALGVDWLDQLYVAPGWTGRGIGGRLVALAKKLRPDGFDLYTFEVNLGARRFYERHGCAEVGRGDGSGNEEGQPDVHYAWRPADPDAATA